MKLLQNAQRLVGVVHWVLLGKLTGKEISLWGITKTAATETVVMIGSVFVIGIVLSVIFYFFNPVFFGGVTKYHRYRPGCTSSFIADFNFSLKVEVACLNAF